MSVKRKIGIYGGSFDPIHLGHLLLADSCCEELKLDELRFVPANVSPLKQDRKVAPNKDRIAMLELAIGGHSRFRVDLREIERGGVSYTVDTLAEIQFENLDSEIYLLMGADSLLSFSQWRNPHRICELAIPVVIGRGGYDSIQWDLLRPYIDENRLALAQSKSVKMPLIELSSSDLRQRAQDNRSLRFRVPRAVEQYIRAQKLYQ